MIRDSESDSDYAEMYAALCRRANRRWTIDHWSREALITKHICKVLFRYGIMMRSKNSRMKAKLEGETLLKEMEAKIGSEKHDDS